MYMYIYIYIHFHIHIHYLKLYRESRIMFGDPISPNIFWVSFLLAQLKVKGGLFSHGSSKQNNQMTWNNADLIMIMKWCTLLQNASHLLSRTIFVASHIHDLAAENYWISPTMNPTILNLVAHFALPTFTVPFNSYQGKGDLLWFGLPDVGGQGQLVPTWFGFR